MNIHDAAADYLRRGWAPIPIPWREKNPGFNGWEKLRVTPETLGVHFNGVRQNIGVLLGEPSGGLVDSDLDCPEALITADYFLPDTGSRFGRASTPDAHRLFIADCPTKKFVDPLARDEEKAMLAELRSTGTQTVFPGSVHKETGEIVEWICDNGPAKLDGARLTRLMGLVAASALIARYWPAHARHDASLALSGALRHSGWSLEQTEIFVKAVVEAAGDEEATDRIRAARDTYASEKPTTGWPRLAEMLGEPIVSRVRDWIGVRGGVTGIEEWPEPGRISQELLPVPAFDPNVLLPESLRGWIIDQAEGMPCPVEFVAVPALVTAGAVIGARCGLRPKVYSHWVSIPNLWGGIVGAPGSKKSPAIYAAFQPLGRLIKAARADHAEAMEDYNARKSAEGDEDDAEVFDEDKPIEKRYKSNDSTVEKLADLLIENPAGLLVQRDELVGLIASWDKQGHEQARAFYLEGWNGYSDYSIDRIKRGSSYLHNLCLSVFGGIQPAKLAAYLNQAQDALADDGMLQRFQMLVYPDPVRWENVDRAPSLVSLNRAFGVFEALAEMVPIHWGAGSHKAIKFPYFTFQADAQAVFNEWYTRLHRSRLPAEENLLMSQWLSKADNLFLGLALIFHLIDVADTQIPQPGETLDPYNIPSWAAWVRVDAARRAEAWCDYLEGHAQRIYGLLAPRELRAGQVLAGKIRAGKLGDGFAVRDVIRANWNGLSTPEDVHAALGWLEEEGWLRRSYVSAGPKGGRPANRYQVNPLVRR
jgi:Protein of unknown function (DUF3987)/Bifunctional DNA primase/polymerase, N-terminal